jgi:hypothetical protein
MGNGSQPPRYSFSRWHELSGITSDTIEPRVLSYLIYIPEPPPLNSPTR